MQTLSNSGNSRSHMLLKHLDPSKGKKRVIVSSDALLLYCKSVGIYWLKKKGSDQSDFDGNWPERSACETIQKMRSAKISFVCHCHAQLILHLTHNKKHSKGDILASPEMCDVSRRMLLSCSSEICGQFPSTFGIFLPLSAWADKSKW